MTTSDGDRIEVDLDLFDSDLKKGIDTYYRNVNLSEIKIDYDSVKVLIPASNTWTGNTLLVKYSYTYHGRDCSHSSIIKIL